MDYTYSFFDYKYSIEGYQGQDFDGPMRTVYLVVSAVTILILAILLRKMSRKSMTRYLRFAGLFLIVLEVTKVTWESVWDIRTGHGFNAGGILPLETCSMFMVMAPVAGFGKGKAQRCALAWLTTIGFSAGVSVMLFPNALKWYPFWTFGGFHSMIYHYIMVLTAVLILVTGYMKFEWKDIFCAFLAHFLCTLVVVPVDYIKNWDYMLMREASGIPVLSDFGDRMAEMGMCLITTAMMYGFYFIFCVLWVTVWKALQKLTGEKNAVSVSAAPADAE